jgi:hypothetical protein
MVDAEYFQSVFPEQVRGMKQAPTVRLHLHGGNTLLLYTIDHIRPGYLAAHAYAEAPTHGDDVESTNDDALPALRGGLRVAIPYESIVWVELTREEQGCREIGFLQTASAPPGA